ncbi:MAG: hypothetical protein IPM27_10905 [Nitrosomonadales bacterium]|nr:hypothetical protein [Nitrosomonadales bacterium]
MVVELCTLGGQHWRAAVLAEESIPATAGESGLLCEVLLFIEAQPI